MTFFQEELLEPFARIVRFCKTIHYIPKNAGVILDVGCGPKIRFYKFANLLGIKFGKYIGLDPLLNENTIKKYKQNSNIKLIKNNFNKKLPFKAKFLNCVISHAFLEHISNPKDYIVESLRVLKVGGVLILTTPTPRSKWFIEFLAFKLKLLSAREVYAHKNYFNRKGLMRLIPRAEQTSTKISHQYFFFKLNNLLTIVKKSNA